MMKKLILFVCITILLLGITACSINREESNKVVTVWTLQMGDFSDYMYKIIRKYEKENPHIQIN